MKDVVIDLEKAKQVVNLVHPYIEEGAVYGMTDATASFLNITPEARALYKDNKSMQLSKAHAIVVKELYIRLIASLFIKFDRPIVPTRIFNDFHRAYKYLIDQADKVEELNSSKVPSE